MNEKKKLKEDYSSPEHTSIRSIFFSEICRSFDGKKKLQQQKQQWFTSAMSGVQS